MMRLKGKMATVAGTSGGLGQVIALHCGKEGTRIPGMADSIHETSLAIFRWE